MVGHAAPLLVLRGQQSRQQVAGILSALAPLADDPVDDLVDPIDRAAVSPGRWKRKSFPDSKPAHRAHEIVHDDLERFAHDARLAGKLGVEQRLGDDRQGQAHQVVVRVADVAVVPGFEHLLGVLDHDGRVVLDLLALKRRLGQLSLPPPERPLAGQEALADQRNEPLRHLVLHEIVGVDRRTYSMCSGLTST